MMSAAAVVLGDERNGLWGGRVRVRAPGAFLQGLEARDCTISHVRLYWRMFGSAGRTAQPTSDEGVRRAFTRAEANVTRKGGKYIVRHTAASRLSVHHPEPLRWGRSIDATGHEPLANRRAQPLPALLVALTHYAIISREHFQRVKMTRGDVASGSFGKNRNLDYFNDYDRMGNATEDGELAELVWRHGDTRPDAPVDSYDAQAQWYDRAFVLPAHRILLYGIEKNAVTVLRHAVVELLRAETDAAAAVHAASAPWWDAMSAQPGWCARCWEDSPQAHRPLHEHFLGLFRDPAWRIGVVYRDPAERFLSAYRSKFLLADHDGIEHCHKLFGLSSNNLSIEAVARKLKKHGHKNAHWAPQASFCGATVGPLWHQYTHRIASDNLSRGLLDLVAGRVTSQTEARLALRLSKSMPWGGRGHLTGTAKHKGNLSNATLRALRRFYSDDYRMLSH
jgi:hypothetical protein